MDELEEINNILRSRTGEHSDVIMGMGYDQSLGEKLGITLIATGFEHKDPFKKEEPKKAEAPVEEKIVMTLVTEVAETKVEAVSPTTVEETVNEVPVIDEVNDSHFVLDQTIEEPVHFSFEIESPVNNEIVEEVLAVDDVETVLFIDEEAAELAELSIEAEAMIEEHDLMPTMQIEDELLASAVAPEINAEVFVSMPQETEVFELDMKPASHIDYTTEFVLSKPTNIYASEEETTVIEAEAPKLEEEVILNEEEVVKEVIMEEEVFETSFRMVVEPEEPAMQLVMKEVDNTNVRPNHQAYDMPIDDTEEQRRKVAERIQKLRNLSFNINNGADPNTEFDAVPAYIRRNLDLFGNTLASVENYYSKYTVEQDENNQTQISTINSFLDGKKPD
jgi:cell division protein FtsZ